MIFLPDAENCAIVSSFVWTKHWNVTYGRMDRQNHFGYYGGLQCKQCGWGLQCGHTVKTGLWNECYSSN